MSIEGVLRLLFPNKIEDMMREYHAELFVKYQEDAERRSKEHDEHVKKLMEAWKVQMEKEKELAKKEGYTQAKKELQNRTYVSFEEEISFPMDFVDYNSDEERQAIGAIVNTREYQLHFKHNLVCQAMKKWRDARSQLDPKMMAVFNIVGNQFMELIDFYDNAAKVQDEEPAPSNYNSLLEDD